MAEQYPRVTVDPDPIFVRDGEVWTSAGVTAGMDLALAMTEDDHGPEMSRAIARQMVMFVQRPGGQAQFSAQLAAQRPGRAPLRDVLGWIADHPDGHLGVPALAARAAMSERNFTSSGIDMALRLAELIEGRVAAEAFQLAIEYDPQPPFNSGSYAKASREAKDYLAARSRRRARPSSPASARSLK